MSTLILQDREHPLAVGAGRLYVKVVSATEIEVTSGRYDEDGGTWKSWGIEQSFPWGGHQYQVMLRFHARPGGRFEVGKPDEPVKGHWWYGDRYFETRDWRLHVPLYGRVYGRKLERECGWLEEAVTRELNLWVQADAGRLSALVRQADRTRLEQELEHARRRAERSRLEAEAQQAAVAALEQQLAELE